MPTFLLLFVFKESVGLCYDNQTFHSKPILLITFGNGLAQYSGATPADFGFQTTYGQQLHSRTYDGTFSFINAIHNDYDVWHTGAKDHTGDKGGYMFLVNADRRPGLVYSERVDDLCVGLRYEFSIYFANACRPLSYLDPNVLFEVRSTRNNTLLAQLSSGLVGTYDNLTWEKYGLSFIALESSVNLLITSIAAGGAGNDFVIDDIALRVCADEGTGICPQNNTTIG